MEAVDHGTTEPEERLELHAEQLRLDLDGLEHETDNACQQEDR
jgi:hypothetical protein